jgi:hypothetical protein
MRCAARESVYGRVPTTAPVVPAGCALMTRVAVWWRQLWCVHQFTRLRATPDRRIRLVCSLCHWASPGSEPLERLRTR